VALSVDRLSLTLSGRTVLSEISAAFEPGRVTAVLGANGAGKSSLLRALAALVRPTSGRVLLDGVDVAALPPRERARAIGYLPQEAAVHWNMKVADVVALGRLPHRDGEYEAAIEAALTATGTTGLRDRGVRELSGGERARVLLARALAGKPRWLLADEPLAGLDPAHQLDALAIFRAAADEGAGIVVVLHELTLAARLADTIILLKDGEILANGAPVAVLAPDIIARAYGVEAVMMTDPHGLPVIVPVPRST
jgi:iron complex transport system ATP-binding protein